jgi:hypothetical protein
VPPTLCHLRDLTRWVCTQSGNSSTIREMWTGALGVPFRSHARATGGTGRHEQARDLGAGLRRVRPVRVPREAELGSPVEHLTRGAAKRPGDGFRGATLPPQPLEPRDVHFGLPAGPSPCPVRGDGRPHAAPPRKRSNGMDGLRRLPAACSWRNSSIPSRWRVVRPRPVPSTLSAPACQHSQSR